MAIFFWSHCPTTPKLDGKNFKPKHLFQFIYKFEVNKPIIFSFDHEKEGCSSSAQDLNPGPHDRRRRIFYLNWSIVKDLVRSSLSSNPGVRYCPGRSIIFHIFYKQKCKLCLKRPKVNEKRIEAVVKKDWKRHHSFFRFFFLKIRIGIFLVFAPKSSVLLPTPPVHMFLSSRFVLTHRQDDLSLSLSFYIYSSF